jgi:transcriptional regulator, GntR family
MDIVSLKNSSKTPKYKQIIASIENAIQMRLLKKGDKLPSLNVLKEKHKVSRDTVLMAFNHLKTRGVLHAVSGKGYYVATDIVTTSLKIFLLFDELNAFKEDLYNAFLKKLGNHVEVDIFFHHFNRTVFDKLILDNAGNYSYYIIMPANLKTPKVP